MDAGARNLLENCLSAQPGQHILIVGEEGPGAHYDTRCCDVVAATARALGMRPEVVMAPATRTAADVPQAFRDAVAAADHTIFFARVADQLRFLGIEGGRSMTACYTFTPEALADPFATVDHRLYRAVHDRLVERIEASSTFRISCPRGSELEGAVSLPEGTGKLVDFEIKPFPVMIFPPVDCSRMSGRMALTYPLTSSSTNIYDESVYVLQSPLVAVIDEGEIKAFEGEAVEAQRLHRHFERVGAFAGGRPFAVNSWHTGINPRSHFQGDPMADVERWSNVVFGSPRQTHFHGCGHSPGDVAMSLYDATISFDGVEYWREGRFVFLDDPDIRALLADYPESDGAFDMRWDIGVSEAGDLRAA